MKFDVVAKNFELTSEVRGKIDKSLNNLKRSLGSFTNIERPGTIIIERLPRKEEFLARINFHLPKHSVASRESGTSPEQALHKAAEAARAKVIKTKDLFKDTHEQRRRTKETEVSAL